MKKKGKNRGRRLTGKTRIACFVLLFLTLVGAGYFAYHIYREISPQLSGEQVYQDLSEQVRGRDDSDPTAYDGPDFDLLLSVNPDVVGWIYGADIGIDYPVVQGTDNDYYLHRLWDKSVSEIGAIFLDCENSPDFSDDLSVIYGHHITLDRMFSPLSHYKKQSFYDEHPTMILYTRDQKKYILELFAGAVLGASGELFAVDMDDVDEKEAWIQERIDQSTFQSAVRPTAEDRLVALCTCSYEFTNARFAVFARLVEEE